MSVTTGKSLNLQPGPGISELAARSAVVRSLVNEKDQAFRQIMYSHCIALLGGYLSQISLFTTARAKRELKAFSEEDTQDFRNLLTSFAGDFTDDKQAGKVKEIQKLFSMIEASLEYYSNPSLMQKAKELGERYNPEDYVRWPLASI